MDQSDDSSQLKPLGLSVADAMVIGKKLSEAREQRRITVTDLARKVRIREHFAAAIERGDWASLPPGLNGRGLVRIYARELGVGVPELEPSAHLTAVNAKFERAEQQNTEDVLRAQTIRSYRADEAQPRSTPPRPASRGKETRSSSGSSHTPRPAKTSVAAPKSASPSSNAGKTPPSESSRPRFEANDEEAPLDVLTPDIAAVLGLNLDGSGIRDDSSADAKKDGDRFGSADTLIPTVNVDDILGTEVSKDDSYHEHGRSSVPPFFSPPPVPSRIEAKDSAIPIVSAFPAVGEFEERVTLPEPSILPTTVPIPQSPYREQPQSAVASYVEQIARTHPESMVRGETLVEEGKSSAGALADVDPASVTRHRSAMGLRLAVIGATAVVVAIGVGIGFYLIPSSPRDPDLHIKEIASEPAVVPDAVVSESQGAPESALESGSESGSKDQEANDQESVGDASAANAPTGEVTKAAATGDAATVGTEPQTPADQAAPSNAGLSPQAPQTPQAGAAVVHGAGSGQAATLQPVEEVRPEVKKPDAPAVASNSAPAPVDPNQRTLGSGTSVAKLVITEPVDIQIRIDDGVVLDGPQAPGPIQVLFSKKTEIVVQDGSKVELTYGDWVHGPLGQKGRKRRIILNAASFRSEASPQTSP